MIVYEGRNVRTKQAQIDALIEELDRAEQELATVLHKAKKELASEFEDGSIYATVEVDCAEDSSYFKITGNVSYDERNGAICVEGLDNIIYVGDALSIVRATKEEGN